MALFSIFSSFFSFSFFFFLFTFPLPLDSREIKVYNRCPFTTWAAIQGPGNPAGGGFKLDSEQTKSIFVDEDWSGGKIWPRTHCDKRMSCETGGCGSNVQCNGASGAAPFTLAQISLAEPDDDAAMDMYNVSLANGYNIPVLIDAYGGDGLCGRAGGCVEDPNERCKAELAVVRGSHTVGCRSDCINSSLESCQNSSTAKLFKVSCPGAFAHQYDDTFLTKTCRGAIYVVQFC